MEENRGKRGRERGDRRGKREGRGGRRERKEEGEGEKGRKRGREGKEKGKRREEGEGGREGGSGEGKGKERIELKYLKRDDRFSSTDPGCLKPEDFTRRDNGEAGTKSHRPCLFYMIFMNINTNELFNSLILDGDKYFLISIRWFCLHFHNTICYQMQCSKEVPGGHTKESPEKLRYGTDLVQGSLFGGREGSGDLEKG